MRYQQGLRIPLPRGRAAAWTLGAWLLVYLLLALRRVYARPWPWTALRYGVLLACYSTVGLLLVGGVLVAAVLTA